MPLSEPAFGSARVYSAFEDALAFVGPAIWEYYLIDLTTAALVTSATGTRDSASRSSRQSAGSQCVWVTSTATANPPMCWAARARAGREQVIDAPL
jgi:hypothetical protein